MDGYCIQILYPAQMNHSQLELILSKYTDEIAYWAPEILYQKYHYMNSEKEDTFVIIILHENKDAFKARIRGTIVDNWLNKDRFGSLAHRCVAVLEQFDNLADWQLQLIDLFKSYI